MTLRPSLPRRALALLWLTLLPVGTHAAECSLAVPQFSFGSYSPFAGEATESSGIFEVQCTSTMAETVMYEIRISTGSSNSYIARGFAGAPLEYNLFTDAGYTQVWGDGSDATDTVSASLNLPGTGTSSAMHTVYGRIPALQDPGFVGEVADTLTVILNF